MNLLSPEFWSHAPALDVREEALRDAKLHGAYGTTEAARRHQEQSENAANDQSVRSPEAVISESVSEHEANDSGIGCQPPAALAPQREGGCQGSGEDQHEDTRRIGATLRLHVRLEDQR